MVATKIPLDIGHNWTYIRRSEDFQDVFWTSYVRSIHVLCLEGWDKPKLNAENVTVHLYSMT